MLHVIGLGLYFLVAGIILLGILPHIFSPGKFLEEVNEIRSASRSEAQVKRFFGTQGSVYIFGIILHIVCLATINWPISFVFLAIWSIPIGKSKAFISVKYLICSLLLILELVNITSIHWTIHVALRSINITL